MEKIIFVSSASSFLGKEIIRFYEKKEFFIISYCEHLVPLKKTNHIRVNNFNKLHKIFKKTKHIDLFFLNNGLIGNQFDFNYLIKSHFEKTKSLLNISKKTIIERLIFFRTADEVGLVHKPIKENDKLNPQTKYAFSKALTLKYIENFCNKHDIRYIFFRLFLVVGEGQNEPRLFPLIKKNIQANHNFFIKTPFHTKNFLHINDFIHIIYKILSKKNTYNQTINIGSNNNINMINLCKIIKINNRDFLFKKSFNREKIKQVPNITKLKKLIGNYEFINIDEIIKTLI